MTTVTPGSAELLAQKIMMAKSLIACDKSITYPSQGSANYVRKSIKELIDAAEEFLRLAAKPADEGWREPAAKWLEQEADLLTNSLHCGDNSITIQWTHNTASALKLSAKIIRASTEAPKP